jgi:hypothetical protein
VRVRAIAKRKKLKPGQRQRAVRLVVKNSQGKKSIKKVRTQCRLDGERLQGRDKRKACAVTVKRNRRKAVVRVKPKCSVQLKVRVRIVAKAPGAERKVWKRTWGVKNKPRIECTTDSRATQ